MANTPVPANIDEYIAAAAPAARPLLKGIRRVVRAAAPEAEEFISYGIPALKQHGILIYFAAFNSTSAFSRRCAAMRGSNMPLHRGGLAPRLVDTRFRVKWALCRHSTHR